VSAEHLEIVNAAVAALNRGDWDTALQAMAPDFRYDVTRSISLLAGVYEGDQMRELFEEFLGPWEDARYETGEPIEAGEHVVVQFTSHFRGRDGIEVSASATWVWTFRDDTVTRLTLFQDHDEALAFAGVRR
jgi:ketosteroid isomerase-like protein